MLLSLAEPLHDFLLTGIIMVLSLSMTKWSARVPLAVGLSPVNVAKLCVGEKDSTNHRAEEVGGL